MPDRYLFIVDTSFSMNDRAKSVQTIVGNLLLSGMNGEMRRGDSVGVWTFNNQLYTGRLPLQRWAPQSGQIIAVNTVTFLSKQRYETTTDLKPVLAEMFRVITNSGRITIILISDGDEKIHGTPFDAEINATYELNHKPLRKAHIPFTTVFRAEGGQIIGYVVNTDVSPIKLPPLPEPPQVVEAPKPPPPEPKSAPVVEPIIVVGKKPETNVVAKPTEPAVAVPEKPAEAQQSETNESVKLPPVPGNQAVVTAVVVEKPAPIPEPKKEPEPVSPTTAPPPTPAPQPIVAVTNEAPKTEPVTSAPPVVKIETRPPIQPSEPAVTEVKPEAQTIAQIVSPSAATNVPAPQPGIAAKPVVTNEAKLNETESKPPPPVPAQVATTVPTQKHFRRPLVWIIGIVVITAVLVVVLLLRRSRSAPEGSLITRSFEQEKK